MKCFLNYSTHNTASVVQHFMFETCTEKTSVCLTMAPARPMPPCTGWGTSCPQRTAGSPWQRSHLEHCSAANSNSSTQHWLRTRCLLQLLTVYEQDEMGQHCNGPTCPESNRGAGHLLSDHVAVEIDGNVKRFDREGLRQLQCWRCTKTFAVETFYITIYFNCYVIAQQVPRPLPMP